jgi:peptidoglycan hydrolase-like protein with peptidoglycan-binding domain
MRQAPRLNTFNIDSKVVVDGVYGVVTATAIEVFQRKQGLTADGIVGPQTWDKLFS